ncbi:MAG: M28 family peptidase [Flavobacteriaceae bacterium]|nr:M28 family peptidase [Flavobacteriaceae bacterium]
MNIKLIALVFLAFVLASCNGQSTDKSEEVIDFEQTRFNTASLLQHVEVLSSDALEGRRTGTASSLKAKDYIIAQLKILQVKPLTESYEQQFSFKNKEKSYQGINVLGKIEGSERPDKYIVISAHYDHEGIKNGKIYNGADDDASGISALFAFAEYFQKNPPKHSVILAAFDAEELGLQGSRYFVDNVDVAVGIENIVLNINMDMISRNEKDELYVVGSGHYIQLKSAINIELPENFNLLTGHDGLDGKQNWMNSSDHAPFHKKEIPFLYFGEEDHKDYHQPSDDFENIHPNFYVKAVYTIISVFENLDKMNL